MTRRLALLLEYDGSGFAGSQLQKDARTVQSVLEAAVAKATSVESRVAFAGRTDAGVHARGQVAAFTTDSPLDLDTMQRALNAWLPEDVVVRQCAEVDASFDPRRDAIRRHYRYVIDNHPHRPALARRRAWHIPKALDESAMARAAASMLGRHDFAAFASRLEEPHASTVREIFCFSVERSRRLINCNLQANAFLPHQVRRMIGPLVEVGKGELNLEQHTALLAGPPASAGPAAPAHGLYLMHVTYEPQLFEESLVDSGLEV